MRTRDILLLLLLGFAAGAITMYSFCQKTTCESAPPASTEQMVPQAMLVSLATSFIASNKVWSQKLAASTKRVRALRADSVDLYNELGTTDMALRAAIARVPDTVVIREVVAAADTAIKACRLTLSNCEQRAQEYSVQAVLAVEQTKRVTKRAVMVSSAAIVLALTVWLTGN